MTYESPALAADQVAAVATAAEVGILKERVLQAFDRLEAINGAAGPWSIGLWAANDVTLKELQGAFTGRSGISGIGYVGLGMYKEQADHLFAQMQIDDVGLVFSV